MGATRLVCTNGMTIGVSFGGYSLKHYKGTLNGGEIRNAIVDMVSRTSELVKIWEGWDKQRITYAEAKSFLENRLQWPAKYQGFLATARFPMTRWAFYNHCTYAATHMTKSFNRRVEMDNQIADVMYDDM